MIILPSTFHTSLGYSTNIPQKFPLMFSLTRIQVMDIPVSELVSSAFSTIPICPFLIQRIFSFTCLLSFFTCLQQIACIFSLLLLSHDMWL